MISQYAKLNENLNLVSKTNPILNEMILMYLEKNLWEYSHQRYEQADGDLYDSWKDFSQYKHGPILHFYWKDQNDEDSDDENHERNQDYLFLNMLGRMVEMPIEKKQQSTPPARYAFS